MVRRIVSRLTSKISGLHEAAFWLALFSLLSQILGFVRDRLLAHNFGAGMELDMYYASFRIPDLLFVTSASIFSASILVPFIALRALAGRESLNKFINSSFTFFFAFLTVSCAITWIFIPKLVPIFFSGLGESNAGEVITLSRILLLSPFFLGLSNFFSSILQYEKRFLLYSLSPLLYNIGIIFGILFFGGNLGIKAAVLGVCIGAFAHFGLQALYLYFSPDAPRFTSRISFPEIKKVLTISVPRTVALSTSSLVGLILVSIASRFSSGSVSVFTFAFNLQSILLALIGASYSMAAFPTLVEHYTKNEIPEIIKCLSSGLRHIIFWSFPLSALFIVLRAHIVRVVLGSGAFDWSDTRMTAAVLALFVWSVSFQGVQLLLTRAHYAFGKTKLPLIMNLVGAIITVIIAISVLNVSGMSLYVSGLLSNVLKVSDINTGAVLMLPLAFSLGSLVSAGLLWFSIPSIMREAREGLTKMVSQVLLATLSMTLASILGLRIFNNVFYLDTALNVFLHGLTSGILGLLIYYLVLSMLGNEELKVVTSKFRRDISTS